MKRKRILSFGLYALPVVFFIVAYFLILTSGEDIFQGANTAPDVLKDAVDAFNHSARLSDMYAWSVINFFDYSFSFGVDVIFRIIDVLMAFSLFYILTDFVAGHRPRLEVKDALIFNLIFILTILTSNGRVLYSGFSAIHNYLIIALTTAIFAIPFIRTVQHRTLPSKKILYPFVIIGGFIFGISSNLTPIAFLMTLVICLIIYKIAKKVKLSEVIKNNLWILYGAVAVCAGLVFTFALGPGLSDYYADYSNYYDYVSFDGLFAAPFEFVKSVFSHEVYNFGRLLIPIVAIGVGVLVYRLILKHKKMIEPAKLSEKERNTMILCVVFAISLLLTLSQIKAPTRLMLPAYLSLLVSVLIPFRNTLNCVATEYLARALALPVSCAIIASLVVIIVRTGFAIEYRNKVAWVYEKAEAGQDFCVTPEQIAARNLPYIYLGQEDILVDWAMPQEIYGSKVSFCE